MAFKAIFFKKICNQELHCQEIQESQESYDLFNGHTNSSMKRADIVTGDSKSGCRLTYSMAQTMPTVALERLMARSDSFLTVTIVFNGGTKVFNDGFIIGEQQRWSTSVTAIGEITVMSASASTVLSSVVSPTVTPWG